MKFIIIDLDARGEEAESNFHRQPIENGKQ
jgi:hypothetical protein